MAASVRKLHGKWSVAILIAEKYRVEGDRAPKVEQVGDA